MYIFSFRSRTQSMKFYDMLREENIPSKIINTPREVSVGCGLSVMVNDSSLTEARRVFGYTLYDTFLGLFQITDSTARRMDF